jgi:hypothetical protein
MNLKHDRCAQLLVCIGICLGGAIPAMLAALWLNMPLIVPLWLIGSLILSFLFVAAFVDEN